MSGRSVLLAGSLQVRLAAMAVGVMLLCPARMSAAPSTPRSRPTAAAEVAALNGAMPRSFDLYLDDPCAGTWDIRSPDGDVVGKVTVMRYRNIPLAHISGPGASPFNEPVTRLDPHSIKLPEYGVSAVMRCTGTRAVFEMTEAGQTRSNVLIATPGAPDAPPPSPPARDAAHASVRERNGNIQYVDAGGAVHQLTQGGNYSEPVLSPDGHTVAFIHLDGKPTVEGESGFTSLWVADAITGTTRRLLTPRSNDEPSLNLTSFQHPRFSLDGGFVYIDADAWATSAAVHQVSVATGVERFVIDGSTRAIVRTGKYRGYLLIGRHKYRPAPQFGSFDPVYVVRPDANETFIVPGSDKDDGERSVAAWLDHNGWQAW